MRNARPGIACTLLLTAACVLACGLPAARAAESGKKTEEPAEPAATPVTIEGKVYKGKRLQPRKDFFVLWMAEQPKTKRYTRKKEAANPYETLAEFYKLYQEAQRDWDKVVADYNKARKKATEEYKSGSGSSGKSLKEVLKEIQEDYDGKIKDARDETRNESDKFVEAFKEMIFKAKSTPATASAVSTDTGGAFKLTLPGPGTYYILFPEPVPVEGANTTYAFSRILIKEENPEQAINIEEGFVFTTEGLRQYRSPQGL